MRTSRDEASRSMIKLKEVEGELAAARTRCEEQAQDLVKKSGKTQVLFTASQRCLIDRN